MWSWPSDWLEREEAAIAVAALNAFGSLGGFCGPALFGGLSSALGGHESRDHTVAMLVIGIGAVLGAIMSSCFQPTGRRGDPARSPNC